METYHMERDAQGRAVVRSTYRGLALLEHPIYNQGSAFPREVRQAFDLEGLLPAAVSTMAQQAQRIYANIARHADPLDRYVTLTALQDRNEHLFYRVLLDHLEEFLPIVYTPTVGRACQQYSHVFRRGRGIWITPQHKGHVYEVLGNAPYADIRLIVVTDNERILGLGDQGAGGMGIPIGKLALYTAAAGIHPTQTLPVSLDVGTDNPELLADELYLGWRRPRLRGPEYDQLVDEFVQAVRRRFPRALLQWEDFKQQNAFNLLDRYRQSLPSFNDDIQGTAAVATAGVLAAVRATGSTLARQRVVILGAGAAGIGIARQLRDALKRVGVSGDALVGAVAVLDSHGLLIQGRELREASKHEFAWPAALAKTLGFTPERPGDLAAVVTAIKPTVLIGTSGQAGVFTRPIITTMAKSVDRPAIFPFSNPTSKSEATPADLIAWTDGRALVATGSPFAPVNHNGRTIRIGQGNNVYIFPGVGLGAMIAQVKVVTDALFTVAAQALAEQVCEDDFKQGLLYPPITKLRQVTARIASAVVSEARSSGIGRPMADTEIAPAIAAAMWEPAYPELLPT